MPSLSAGGRQCHASDTYISTLHLDRGTKSRRHLDLGTNYVYSDWRPLSSWGMGVLGLVAVGLLLGFFFLVFTLFVLLRLHSAQGGGQ